MVCIEKCLHFKRKCRHHPHPILDILPVYLTRGISIAGGLLFRTSPFLRWEKLRCTQHAKAHNKKPHKAHKYRLCEDMFSIQTLGRRDLSGCFLVHICAFYSSYSSYFVFLCAPSKIFRAKMEPIIQSSFPH